MASVKNHFQCWACNCWFVDSIMDRHCEAECHERKKTFQQVLELSGSRKKVWPHEKT